MRLERGKTPDPLRTRRRRLLRYRGGGESSAGRGLAQERMRPEGLVRIILKTVIRQRQAAGVRRFRGTHVIGVQAASRQPGSPRRYAWTISRMAAALVPPAISRIFACSLTWT